MFIVQITGFVAILKEKFAKTFLKFSKMTPADTDLRKTLIDMQKWSFYKN